jgi:hypothetical protein
VCSLRIRALFPKEVILSHGWRNYWRFKRICHSASTTSVPLMSMTKTQVIWCTENFDSSANVVARLYQLPELVTNTSTGVCTRCNYITLAWTPSRYHTLGWSGPWSLALSLYSSSAVAVPLPCWLRSWCKVWGWSEREQEERENEDPRPSSLSY